MEISEEKDKLIKMYAQSVCLYKLYAGTFKRLNCFNQIKVGQ